MKIMISDTREVETRFEVGDRVMWRGSFGNDASREATIESVGDKDGEVVYDLDNGHWAYEDQLSPMGDVA